MNDHALDRPIKGLAWCHDMGTYFVGYLGLEFALDEPADDGSRFVLAYSHTSSTLEFSRSDITNSKPAREFMAWIDWLGVVDPLDSRIRVYGSPATERAKEVFRTEVLCRAIAEKLMMCDAGQGQRLALLQLQDNGTEKEIGGMVAASIAAIVRTVIDRQCECGGMKSGFFPWCSWECCERAAAKVQS